MRDGGHRTQLRERAPEPVISAEMCRVQSSRPATVEALSQIMRVPEVEVPDLWTLDAHNVECPADTSNALVSRGGTVSSATLDTSARAPL